MDKIKSILKKNLKLSTAILASIILCGGSVYATILLSSGEVSYTNNGQSNVEGALDELYTLAGAAANKECQEGYTKGEVKVDGSYRCLLPPPSIATSSWSDIIAGYNAGNTSQLEADMAAGTTRNIELTGGLGIHPVRIANLTPCSEANTVSQSACGLVIEFADVISEHQMNPYTDGTTNGDGNKGGWQYSDMRAYVNSTTYTAGSIDYSSTGIYSNMPSDLKPLIISTSVVSGYGYDDYRNFTTDDYMYLLSMREVWNYQGNKDTASGDGITRQLDYYNTKGVTTSSYSAAIKQRNGNGFDDFWWLRTPDIIYDYNFNGVLSDGSSHSTKAMHDFYGVSPAFRLASGIDLTSVNFASSPWGDIAEAYKAGITTQLQADMEAGVTRDITLGGVLGTHPVRIANLTPCSEANTVSQSACGLVIEFADVISEHQMNPYTDGTTNGDGNKGGWQYSDMRAYVNSTTYTAGSIDYSSTGIYSNMPSDLKPLIISTSVVSGHGSNDSANFTTNDYMYLLSIREVYNYQGQYDTASQTDSVTNKAYTRQLDYYSALGVTTSSDSALIKENNSGGGLPWWLRSARSDITYMFSSVNFDGYISSYPSENTYGVSPAFRLAE